MKTGLRVAEILVRCAVGAVFLYAAFSKVPAFDAFAEEIANYRVLPAHLVAPFAAVLPGVELLAGALLVLRRWVRPACAILGAMLLVFIVALSQALLRGINLSCGCFGGSELATWGTVGRDVAILIGVVATYALNPPRQHGKS